MSGAQINHGTDGAYTNHRCRCEACRAAHAASTRAYRKANPPARRERGRSRYGPKRAQPPGALCVVCHAPAPAAQWAHGNPRGLTRLYCSDRCRNRFHRLRYRERWERRWSDGTLP